MLGRQTKSIMVCYGIFLSGPLFTVISRNVVGKKVHVTIPKGIVGGFEFTVFQRNLKEWQERPWIHVCECYRKATKLGSTGTVVRNNVLTISHITFQDCRVHIFSDNLSRNSCIYFKRKYQGHLTTASSQMN